MQLWGAGLRSKALPDLRMSCGRGRKQQTVSECTSKPRCEPEEGSAAGELSLISFIPKIR